MKKLLLGALALSMLASCSNDDEGVISKKGDNLTFSCSYQNALTRGSNGYCNNNKPQKFYVWGLVQSGADSFSEYFRDKEFSTTDFLTWSPTGDPIQWAGGSTGKNLFFAYTDEMEDLHYSGTLQGLYEIPSNVVDQKDLCFATFKGVRPTDGKVQLNFKHVLSLIEFNAKNASKYLHFEIKAVKVMNVKGGKGWIYFPTTTTESGYNSHTSSGAYGGYGDAYVSGFSLPNKSYEVVFDNLISVAKNQTVDLTTSSSNEYNANTMYLVPQSNLNTWDKTTDVTAVGGKPCIAVKLNIWNISSGSTVDKSKDVLLYGDAAEGKWVYAPIPNAQWEMGKRYKYTITLDGSPIGNTGDEVLNLIHLDVAVDDYYEEFNNVVK